MAFLSHKSTVCVATLTFYILGGNPFLKVFTPGQVSTMNEIIIVWF